MIYITGTHRLQTYIATLDDQVSADNGVRLMDAFVDKLDLPNLVLQTRSIKAKAKKTNGMPKTKQNLY